MILWPGICPTHHNIQEVEILKIKEKHPKAEILVHPECRPEIIDLADHVFSTSGMVHYSKESDIKEFIIGTELRLGPFSLGYRYAIDTGEENETTKTKRNLGYLTLGLLFKP